MVYDVTSKPSATIERE
ncbi:TPA: hypothetical protein ROY01_004816 [Bacillus toyonensis]|nr:hypothetical protein [Bacillus toyonensis]